MIVVLLNGYIALLALFVWLRFIPFNLFWKLSPALVLILLLVAFFIPMGWGAPSGPVLVLRNSVQIVPAVAGNVIEVPIQANVDLKEGDILFKLDPTPYEAQANAIAAQLMLAEQRLAQMSQLQEKGVGRGFDVEQRQSEAGHLRAQLEGAKWNLEQTVVRAPAAGYVTNLALRKGARVTGQAPVMAFIDTADTLIGVEIAQNSARYVEVGQPVEVTFKPSPGAIYSGRVEAVLQAVSSGQTQVSGSALEPAQIVASPFVIRIRLDDQGIAKRLPAGSTGAAAIYTSHVRVSHAIRKVILRQTAILNYINPF